MTAQDDTRVVLDIARRACAVRGLDADGLRLIRHYSNAVVAVPAAAAVARVATGVHDRRQLVRSVEVSGWLARVGFPAVAPLAGADPVALGPGVSVSFWTYLAQPDPPAVFDSADLARLVAGLHGLPPPPVQLASWAPLTSLADALQTDRLLASADRDWLRAEIRAVRARLAGLTWPLGMGLVHGDAWQGNLLAGPCGPVLGDWDRVARGPREVDLLPTWHATRRYGRDRGWADRFAEVYGYDLRASPFYEDLMAMRDLAQLPGPLRRAPHSAPHARALRQRLGDIRSGRRHTRWEAL